MKCLFAVSQNEEAAFMEYAEPLRNVAEASE